MKNWLLIIVMLIFLICMIYGGVKGFFKIGISLASSVLTVVIVIYMAPFVGKAVQKYTPLDEMVADKCVKAFMPKLSPELLQGVDLSGTPLAYYSIDELAEMGQEDWKRLGIEPEQILDVIGQIPKDQQIKQIEESILPGFFKDTLLENNNSTVYEELGIDSFPEYVGAYIARMVVNVVSFLVTFVFAIIIVKALIVAVDIIGELPGIGALNHAGGVVLGMITALLIVWIVFLGVTVLYSTEVGKMCFDMIDDSSILTMLYNKNILLSMLLSF